MQYTIWLTEACNLRCNYCYEGVDKNNTHMTEKTAQSTINYILRDIGRSNAKEVIVNFHGGEPFLNFQTMKYIVCMLKERLTDKIPIYFTTTTNGTVFNEEIRGFILRHNIEMTFSIDGNKHTHDSIRVFADGKGSHEIALKNAKSVIGSGLNVRIRMTCNPETISNLSDNVIFLLSEGFNTIVPALNYFSKEWDEHHIEILETEIIKIKKNLVHFKDSNVGLCEKLNFCGGKCNGGISTINIYSNGNLYPCTISGGKEEFLVGNVEDGVDTDKLKLILDYSKVNNLVCTGCDLKKYCQSTRCKILNKLITGNFNIPILIDCNITNLLYKLNGIEMNQHSF